MSAMGDRTFNVGVINRYDPQPYTFTEAAICLRDSIAGAGLRSEIHTNRADRLHRCIVLGALPPHLGNVDQLDPARTVIYNFEQLGSGSSLAGSKYAEWLQRWVVADYHERNIDWLRAASAGRQLAFELPLVPSPSLAFRPELPAEPVVDVLFYGTPTERRGRVIEGLQAAGMSVEEVAGAFGHELTPAIKRARLVLHVHFYETGLFPVARFLQPVIQGVPIVCESSVFSTLGDWSGSGIVFAPYEGLVDACRKLLASRDECAERAARNRAHAAAIDFATPFERLVRALDARGSPRPPAPQPIPAPSAAPRAAPVTAPATARDGEVLTEEEIVAILERESEQLPPEAHLPAPPPVKLVERTPGKGPYGVWIVILLLVFSLYTIWLAMRR